MTTSNLIVLEGPDGGGKSTLAAKLSDALGMRVHGGAGPPRGPGEIEERLAAQLQMIDVIFDRHTAVSQPIYARIRGEMVGDHFAALAATFYARSPLIVYCRSLDASRHVVKQGEDPAHVAALEDQYDVLVAMYDRWALGHAHLLYRIGDDVDRLISLLRASRQLAATTAAVKRDVLRRVNEANRRPDGHPARLTSLGATLEAVVEGLVAREPSE